MSTWQSSLHGADRLAIASAHKPRRRETPRQMVREALRRVRTEPEPEDLMELVLILEAKVEAMSRRMNLYESRGGA